MKLEEGVGRRPWSQRETNVVFQASRVFRVQDDHYVATVNRLAREMTEHYPFTGLCCSLDASTTLKFFSGRTIRVSTRLDAMDVGQSDFAIRLRTDLVTTSSSSRQEPTRREIKALQVVKAL